MKMTAAAWINANALLWRMSGTSGDDPFMVKLLENTQAANMDVKSPLGAGYVQHQRTLDNSKPPTEPIADETIAADEDEGVDTEQ
jgi:hypothetical protein